MNSHLKNANWMYTSGRSLLFCLICAGFLALFSGLTKGFSIIWSQILTVIPAAIAAFILTIVFVHWEGLQLKDVGVVPDRSTVVRLLAGFIIGLFLAALQVMLVSLTGHLTLILSSEINLVTIGLNLLLYSTVALREEIAFRGYPLRSINYLAGPWKAQLFVAVIFVAEHVSGGMTWSQAILGSGTGALLFGLAALRTKGIALPIGLHSAWNFGQWSFGFKNETGIFKAVVEKGQEVRVEQIGMCCYLVIMGLAIVSLYSWKKSTF